MSSSFAIKDCDISFEARPHKKYSEGITVITGSISHPEHGEIAHVRASTIDRWAKGCWGNFLLQDLEKPDMGQMSTCFFKLFDKYGTVRRWHIRDDWHRGLGIWGEELNAGLLAYVGLPQVDNAFVGKGVDFTLMKALLAFPKIRNAAFFLSYVPSEYGVQSCISNKDVWFLRLNGFRRIGRLNLFGHATNSTQPSRAIAIHDDLDMAPVCVETDYSRLGRGSLQAEDITGDDRHLLYPMHSAMAAFGGVSEAELDFHLCRLHLANPNLLHSRDDLGHTPLYTAIMIEAFPIVRTLLELGAHTDIDRRDNPERQTAWELCVTEMRECRELAVGMKMNHTGNKDAYLRIKYLLKKAMGHDVPGTEDEYIKLKKWCCSCGQCSEGWLSPRMKARLIGASEELRDAPTLPDHLFSLPAEQRLDTVILPIDQTLKFLPFRFRYNMSLSFYRGYRDVFKAIHKALRTASPSTAVTASSLSCILPGWESRDVLRYQSQGGLFDYAFDCVMYSVLAHGPFGTWIWDAQKVFDEDWHRLPKCINDLEFEMARSNVCPEHRGPGPKFGPHVDPSDNVAQMDKPVSVPLPGMTYLSLCTFCADARGSATPHAVTRLSAY